MSLVFEIKVGKRRTIVIPKKIAEILDITEGSRLRLKIYDNTIILEPIPDAVSLSIKGDKFAKISLRELEAESVEEQKRYTGEA